VKAAKADPNIDYHGMLAVCTKYVEFDTADWADDDEDADDE
jgi:hypothetical protein